ncbi:MAG: diguanylate cyclase, partial [Moritella sp.]|uniref:diguanylate cyclase domain-containing protein n=1 Tax=Moritella sp. TaxID=78556 RepID=UPI0029BD64B5
KYSFNITCSIGISIAPLHTNEPKYLLKYADLALYRAKDCGRNNFQFFSPDMQVKHLDCRQA